MPVLRIAAVTDDGKAISRHFGRALFYEVVTVDGMQIVARERREKIGHAHFAGEHHGAEAGSSEGHGQGAEAESRHARMAASIADCQVLLAGGMGQGARRSLESAGIRVILTDIDEIDRAVQAAVSGDIVDHPELLH